jgi:uncharacterized membrane protein YfcA
MFEFSPLTVALIGAVVFVAYVVRGMSGFGTSLVAIPILVFILPLHTAVPLMTLIGLSVTVLLGIRDRRHVRWDEMLNLLPPTLIGVFAGIYLFSALDARLMQRLLGAFIVLYAVYMVASQFVTAEAKSCSRRWAWPAGFGSAFVDSMFGGGGGPLVVIYMHRRGYGAVAFRSTLAVLWLVELLVRVGGYAVGGYYSWSVVLTAIVLLPAMWLGNRTGEAISRRMSQRAFSRLIAVVLFASGVSLLLK